MGPPLLTSSPIARSPKQKRRKLRVISLNCNGIKSPTKKAEFQALIDLHKPDIVLGCESKLDSTIPSYSVFPRAYDIFRKDRTLHGGGVFVAVRNDVIATEEVRLDVHNCEIITVSIKFARTKTLLLSSYYRPPSPDTNALELLDDVLSRIYSTKSPSVILAGDFNCGGIDWSTRNLTPRIAQACDHALLDLSDKYGLTQHVAAPTRPVSGRTLDLVFSSNPGIIQACHVTCGISDHDATLFEVDISPKFTPKPPRKIYQFHKGDFAGLKSSLSTLASDYLSTNPECNTVDVWTSSGPTSLKRF